MATVSQLAPRQSEQRDDVRDAKAVLLEKITDEGWTADEMRLFTHPESETLRLMVRTNLRSRIEIARSKK